MKIAALQVELKKLVRLGLITERPSGNRVYYRANREHPLFREISNLVLKISSRKSSGDAGPSGILGVTFVVKSGSSL